MWWRTAATSTSTRRRPRSLTKRAPPVEQSRRTACTATEFPHIVKDGTHLRELGTTYVRHGANLSGIPTTVSDEGPPPWPGRSVLISPHTATLFRAHNIAHAGTTSSFRRTRWSTQSAGCRVRVGPSGRRGGYMLLVLLGPEHVGSVPEPVNFVTLVENHLQPTDAKLYRRVDEIYRSYDYESAGLNDTKPPAQGKPASGQPRH